MKKWIYIWLFTLTINVFSQREADNWYFGDKAGLNFKNPNPIILNDGDMNTPAGCSSISDKEGNLLFYTNGQTVWNKNHLIMENGDGLAGTIENTQTSIIIPKPGSEEHFYVFSTKTVSTTDPLVNEGLYLSEIEISNTFPLGKVLYKFQSLRDATTERITAVHHADGTSIWLITFGSLSRLPDSPKNAFNLFKIDESGINTRMTSIQEETKSSIGAMKVSSDGKYIAVADYTEENIDLYNFNNETGEITLNVKIFTDTSIFSPKSPYGLEFSSDSKALYYTAEVIPSGVSSINQYIIENPDPVNNPLFQHKRQLLGSTDDNFGTLQLASNQKIYVSSYIQNGESIASSDAVSVIENPNEETPNISRLLDLESGSSFKGLPNFIQSYFRNRIIVENKCVSDFFNFSTDAYAPITSVTWFFGDGNSSSDFNPNHQYLSPGRYTVKAEVTINSQAVSLYKNVEAYPLPQLIPNERLVQCDLDNNGEDNFDLFDIEPKITNPSLNHDFIFYKTLLDAENDENRIPNPENFQNESNPQELFVKAISEKGCNSITNFYIESLFIELGNIPTEYTCENSDNSIGDYKGKFDLRRIRDDIRNLHAVPITTSLKFYPTLLDAELTSNEILGNFNTESTVIYVRAETSLGCGGIEPIQLTVNSSPLINIDDSYTICIQPSQHPPIILDGNSFNDRFEWRDFNGSIISVNREFTLNNIGDFSVTVYKTENGIECSNYKEFTVINPDAPTFAQINVNTEDENNNTIDVTVNGNSTYQFSLDNRTFFGSGLQHTFTNVSVGLKTVYIRDINNCEQSVQTNVSVIGYSKLLTPNGDGKNDFFTVKGLDSAFFKSVNIRVFDRFGKTIGVISDFNSPGWDGTYNGKILPSNDYWFAVEIIDNEDNLIKKIGNFSLIRK